jgi:hypothetical protein
MLHYLSAAEQAHFADLQGKLAQLSITESEQAELASLVSKAQKTAAERTGAIEAVRKAIADTGILITDVFSPEAIQGAAAALTAPIKGARKGAGKAKAVKPVKAGGFDVVLIQVKLDKAAGAPSRYKKGQKLGKFVSKNFKALDVDGKLIENLMKYATPLGKTYFETPEGKAELDVFAKYVSATPVTA